MISGLFVPTTSEELVLPLSSGRFPESDEYLITRYPIDAPSSIQAVEVKQTGVESDRIAGMVVLQYTLTNQLAAALWYVAHDNQRHSQLNKVASAPCPGFPEETTELILNRPGLNGSSASDEPVEIVVVGLQYQLPTAEDYLNKPLVLQVQDIIQAKGNNRIARQVLVSPEPLAGQVAPKDDQYPAQMLGLTKLGVGRLLPGLYAASLRVEGKKWMARLQRQVQA